jgi:hypothetical protein
MARLSKGDPTNGRLQLQQAIIANYQVHPSHGIWRLENVENQDIPREQLFTTTLGNGRGDQFALLHIMDLDLLFSFNDQGKCKQLDVLRESKTKVFSVWNGARVPEGYTQEEYEDLFGFRGFSAKPFFFGKSWQPEMGVAGYVAGSKGVWNRGWTEFWPGDKAAWSLPSIDPRLREEQRAILPANEEHPKMRDAAIINRLSYEDAHLFVQRELTQSFTDKLGRMYQWNLTLPQSNTSLSARHQVAIHLRNIVLFSVFAGLAVLRRYGYVSLHTPLRAAGEGRSPLDAQVYNSNQHIETMPLKDVLPMNYRMEASGSIKSQGRLSAQDQIDEANDLIFVGAKLGQCPLVNQAITPSYNIINAICGVALKGLLMDPDLHKAFDIQRFFPKKMREDSTSVPNPRVDLSRTYRLDTPVGSFRYVQDSTCKQTFNAFGLAIARVESKVCCIALSNARPGEWMDEYH